MEKEIWKSIGKYDPIYEGYYEVSNFGRIKSLERIVERKSGHLLTVKEKIRNKFTNETDIRNGKGINHSYITLSYKAQVKSLPIDEMVLICFGILKPSEEHRVFHIDKNVRNNKLSNLTWMTDKEIEELFIKQSGFEEWGKIRDLDIPNIERYEINRKGDVRIKPYMGKAPFGLSKKSAYWKKYKILKKYKSGKFGMEYVRINIGKTERFKCKNLRVPVCLLYYLAWREE